MMWSDPELTALLVLDYQPAALRSLDGAEGLVTRVSEAITIVRSHGGLIGYVRMAFDAKDVAAIPAVNKLADRVRAAGAAIDIDSSMSAIHSRVAPQPGDIVVRKTRIGAFSTTDLHERLRGRGISTLILAGISTSGVLLSTVRDAADRDYRVLVLADGSADPDPDVHTFLMKNIFPRQADVIVVADLNALLAMPDTTPA